MARDSLSNSSSKLNLSRRQTALFQRIIMAGNHMADAIKNQENEPPSKGTKKLAERWRKLMVELVKMLF